jgi:transposase
MMKAIGAAKKKSDRLDARKIADLVRCNLLPACYVASVEMRELRRLLRYRNTVVAHAVRMKNKMSGLLMEVGAEYSKQQLHGKKYFTELMGELEEVPESVKDMLRLSRSALEMFATTQRQLLNRLQKEPALVKRLELLRSIGGVGEVTSLTWALEVCDPRRFPSIGDAVSYCGLTSALVSSADKQQRGPISKQRNPHLQTVLIEAAKLAPRWNRQLAELHERELKRGNRNRATLAVARKMVAYLFANQGNGGRKSGLTRRSELTSGKGDFPTKAARRDGSGARTVLAVKGSLRRAKTGRALDGSGPFRRKNRRDGRLRRENHPTPAVCSDATIDQRFTGRSSPKWGCTTEVLLPMCHFVCFEAGRFTQTQSSWTALSCSRKWMSGPADALAQSVTDRKRSIVALTVGFIMALQILPGSAGSSVFPLDKSLSWMSCG